MIVKSLLEAPGELVVAHHGQGQIWFQRPLEDADFDSDAHFVDFVRIPPGASIGIHTHGENEEIYFIVEGSGIMHTNAEERPVSRGDLILNRRGWTHGLRNPTAAELLVLVVEITYRPEAPKTSSASWRAS